MIGIQIVALTIVVLAVAYAVRETVRSNQFRLGWSVAKELNRMRREHRPSDTDIDRTGGRHV